jgi:phage replication O-like protein O
MSGPQLEDGYTRIANELLDEILRYPLTKRQLSVLLAVIRKTYGYNKKADDISSRQLARMTGIDQADCARTVRELTRLGVLLKDSGRYGHRLM